MTKYHDTAPLIVTFDWSPWFALTAWSAVDEHDNTYLLHWWWPT